MQTGAEDSGDLCFGKGRSTNHAQAAVRPEAAGHKGIGVRIVCVLPHQACLRHQHKLLHPLACLRLLRPGIMLEGEPLPLQPLQGLLNRYVIFRVGFLCIA